MNSDTPTKCEKPVIKAKPTSTRHVRRRQGPGNALGGGGGGCPAALAFLVLALSACSHMSTLPQQDNVKVSRDEPSKDCAMVSKVEGRSTSIKGTADDALKDLKQEAANKGANYLVVNDYYGYGTSVTGVAYKCP